MTAAARRVRGRTGGARHRRLRERTGDLAGIGFAALVALFVAGDAEETGRLTGDAAFWALALAGAGCAALWWRRRHPVGVAVLLAPLAAVAEPVGGAVLVAVYTVAGYRRWSVTVAVAALHVLVAVPYAVARPDPALTVPGAVAVNVALLAIAVAAGVRAGSRRALLASLRERAVRAEADAALREERLRARERERIAREMHDVLAHRISLVSLHAGALEIRPDLSAEEVARTAGIIRAGAHQALEDLRDILGVLRAGAGDDDLRPPPGLDDLDDLVAECRSAGTPVEVDDRLAGAAVPASVGRTAYVVIREGLTNARKHAPGAPVHLRLDRTPAGELHLWLRNGLVGRTGAPAVPGSRCGLVGLAERVSLAGGRLDHGVRRGTGGDLAFHLETWLPWPA
ncbi:sensor histidine kinase [Planosporangium sp. 12N6]|uniref:sensor histidine kinase n=1 Tax=Planosporangium spinosum TaxID=3402278 RepID=UPI003CE7D85A